MSCVSCQKVIGRRCLVSPNIHSLVVRSFAGLFQPDLSAVPVKSALKKSTGKYGHDATMPPHLSGRLLVPPQMRVRVRVRVSV